MSEHSFVPFRRLLALFTFLAGFALPVSAATEARVNESYGKLPLHFEANQGQTHKDVRFLARGSGYSLYLTSREAVLVLSKGTPNAERSARGTPEQVDAPVQGESVALRMSLVGAGSKPSVSGLEELPGKANYFIGKDPAQWRANVPTYAKVHYREVYPGIDLIYYGNQRQLEYDFVVAPEADPKKIVLGFKGADKLEIDAQGDLVLHAAGGAIHQRKPVIYQEVDGVRQEVAGSYVRKGTNRVGFKVAAYDKSRPLIIDPVVLSYSTYLGGSGTEAGVGIAVDTGSGIAVDADGNAYVTGWTTSLQFPTTPDAVQPADPQFRSWADAFVTKLDPTGSALVYSTYLGGNSGAMGFGITVDASGNAYVTGQTGSTDFPTTSGAFQPTQAGSTDAFVTKLNPTGSGLVYSSYLGGPSADVGWGIAVDADGNAYVTGPTDWSNFPTTPGAFQTTFAGGSWDAFVTKVNPAGSALAYSTYLGGSQRDVGGAIAVDASGHAYVAGDTSSTDFPTVAGAFQNGLLGANCDARVIKPLTCSDAFVTKLNPTGSGLVYSTFLGGREAESGLGIAVDADGSAYVTGWTTSVNFPTTLGAIQPISGGGHVDAFQPIGSQFDVFVTKLNATGTGLAYSTYLGGSRADFGYGIAVDAVGNAYLTGLTGSTDFPTASGAFQPAYFGSGDAFVTKLNPTGTKLVYSTFLGDNDFDVGYGIAVNATGDAYVTGNTWSRYFPTTPDAFQMTLGGDGDAFVAKVTEVARTIATLPSIPVFGTPIFLPGSFPAEDFDRGGEGIAYHDNTPGNQGGQYRPLEDVDIVTSVDPEGGSYVVSDFETGEWLAYSVNVDSSARYDIELRVSSTSFDSAFHVEIDGVNVTGSVPVPNTGSLSAFQWVGKQGVRLPAGQRVLRIVADQPFFNLNSVRVFPTSLATTRSEESAASYTGSWTSYGADTGAFSGGSMLASDAAGATASFSFTGTAVTWIGVRCDVCGIATVSIDGRSQTMVNTAGPTRAPGGLSSEPVFSVSGLASGVTHTIAITVSGTTTSAGTRIAVDAFDVTP